MEVIVTGDRYLDKLVKFVDQQAGLLIEGIKVLKLNPAGLHYVQLRLEALQELESLLSGAPVDYLRAYVSDLGDYRALEQLRRILRLLPSLKVVSALPPLLRDPTPLSLLPFGRLKVLELRGCDLSTSAAKGLLELRYTLEKIICHNSTDALRHVFASRIMEIKDSPQWNRLSFVSCACNRLVLMDESLQLLPAVETLDLSRNKFAKIDNLRKCTKLKHLDLGFNQLISVSFFSEASCHIVKLVLRNNGLTTLHGIGNLKSLEALDVSYNTISNFSELECLAGLPSLKSLWLEGNPLCCARWYRAQVYSYFAHPENLKVDDKEISKKEYWKRTIIIARRQKQPASFGFYSPAKNEAGDGSIMRKKIKVSRLASIESEEESTYIGSDRDSASCDDESQKGEEKPLPDDETEIVDLIKRVEQMKKERSVLWLREFKEWMDHSFENVVNGCDNNGIASVAGRENCRKVKRSHRNIGECSTYVSDSFLASGDDSSTNVLESDNSFAETFPGLQEHWQYERAGSQAITGGMALTNLKMLDPKQEYQNFYSRGRKSGLHIKGTNNHPDTLEVQRENLVVGSQLTAADDIRECQSLLADPRSPPHYQKDLLHRRHNFVEEILQLSADSYSMASSDSDSSGSEDDSCESDTVHEIMGGNLEGNILDAFVDSYQSHNEAYRLVSERTSSIASPLNPDKTLKIAGNSVGVHPHDPEAAHFGNRDADWMEKRKFRREPKRRVVLLLENGKFDFSSAGDDNEQGKLDANKNDCQKLDAAGDSCAPAYSEDRDDLVLDYYNKYIANTEFLETCRECVCCSCILDESTHEEREVALLRGSNDKLYLLLVGLSADGTGISLSLLSYYRVEDIQEILVGLGLQVVRFTIKGSTDLLFVTRSMDKSTKLLRTLKVLDSCDSADNCYLWSLEHVQVEIIEKQIFGGLTIGIYQYSMVLFQRSGEEENSWDSRSILVIDGHVLLCIEDLFQFSSCLKDASCSTYFTLDLCCRISDVSEMVIEASESRCLMLALRCTASQFIPYAGSHESETRWLMHALGCAASLFCPGYGLHKNGAAEERRSTAGTQMWRLKWFSEESLAQFVALLKAIHSGTTSTPLVVRCVP